MRLREVFLAAISFLVLPAAAAVVVSFHPAYQYTDVGVQGYDADTAMSGLESHLQRLGARYLAPDRTLRVEFLDIDLAGRVELGRYPVRIMKDSNDAPKLRLRYTLEAGGRVLDSGEDTLTDTSYMQFKGRLDTNESLYYEKRLLDEWFKAHFAQAAAKR
jgi:hypothetical protein